MNRKIELISGINAYDNGSITPPLTNNLLCCVPCQKTEVEFQNVNNQPLTITSIDVADDASLTATVIAINGGSVTLPFTVAPDEFFTVTFEICRGTGTLSPYWKLSFTTTQHGNEPFFYVPMNCVTLDDLVTPDLILFTNVIPNTIVTDIGTIQNNTLESFNYNIDISACANITGTNLSGTIVPGQTISYTVSWSPTTHPQSLSCLIEITADENTEDCTTKIAISGSTANLDCDPEGGICCLNVTLNTEQQYLNPANLLCEPSTVYNRAAILERKFIVYDLKWFEPITQGTQIIFNPYLFSTNTGGFNPFSPPAVFYSLTYGTSLVNGNAYNMLLSNAGVNANNQKNTDVTITFLDPANGIFRITIIFFVVCDRNFLVNNSVFSNKFKYQKSTTNDSALYGNTLPSVYNQDEYILSYFRVKKGVIAESEFIHAIPFTARFYNKGLYNGASEFTFPSFTLSRNVGIVNELSIFERTKITFNITVATVPYQACDDIIFHLVDETLNDNTLMFIPATDASRQRIGNTTGNGVLNNHITSPSTFTSIGGDVWEASCYINTDLDPTHQYRMFAIVYSRNQVVNTFKSDSYKVRSVPEYDCTCQPEITSYWDNYFETRQTDDYRPVGKERIQHRLVLKTGTIQECLDNWGLPITDWRQALTSVKLRIYKRYMYFPVSNDPNTDYVTFFEFGNYVSTRNNAAVGNWDNFTTMDVLDVNADEIHISLSNIRVLWENTSFNGNVSQAKIQTYMDKYPITGALATSYVSTLDVINTWIDDDIYFEYDLEFDLSSYFGTPFKFHICRSFMVRAISFEFYNSGFPTHIINQYIEGFDTTINSWVPLGSSISASAYSLIRITYTTNYGAPFYGWFNFFIETLPFGLPTLVESNAIASPTGLTNYGLADIVQGQSYTYATTSIAQVVIDTTQLQNTVYLFCGYWSELTDNTPCGWFNVHKSAGGSPQVQLLPNPSNADYFTLTFLSASQGNYIYMNSLFGVSIPVNGQSYTLHYSFSIPLTNAIHISLGVFLTTIPNAGDIIIPAGSQVGIIPIVWPFANSGNWTIKIYSGTSMSGYYSFALGTEDCATSPWD
jgi:hypothetical protein